MEERRNLIHIEEDKKLLLEKKKILCSMLCSKKLLLEKKTKLVDFFTLFRPFFEILILFLNIFFESHEIFSFMD